MDRKPMLHILCEQNDVTVAKNASVNTMEKALDEAGIPYPIQEPVANATDAGLRPAPPRVKHGAIVLVSGLEISDVTKHKAKPYITAEARTKYETTPGAGDGTFTPYSFRKNGVVYPFIPDERFEALYADEQLSSFKLVAELTGEDVPANNYDASRQGVIWNIERVVSVTAQKRDVRAKFEDYIFSPKTFQSNPELLSKSGMLDSILSESTN